MRHLGAAALAIWLSVWPAVAEAQPAPGGASARVRDAGGRVVAEVTLREAPDQVLIALIFPDRSLTGTHAIQIHDTGQCDPPDFASAGGVFNPFGKQHGLLNPDGPMVGDLPSLVIGPSGLSSYNTAAPLAKLGSGGPASLLRPGGTSLVIFAQADDDHSQPEGNAGARIACGAIVPGPLDAGASAPISPSAQSSATADSRFGTAFIALGGLLLIGVGVALRQRRLRL